MRRIICTTLMPGEGSGSLTIRISHRGILNSENDGVKEQPLFPEAYKALLELQYLGARGLVFHIGGNPLVYRLIQFSYDKAFREAGLPYSGTRVMRHGGCRNLHNEVPDIAVAQQLLGNSSLKTTTIYAKRHKAALTNVARQKWAEHLETGRNWSQIEKGEIRGQ